MLMSNGGVVKVSGRKIDLMAEFSQLVNKLIECDAFDKNDVDFCIKIAYMSEEERMEEGKKVEKKLIETILKTFE